MKVQFSISCSLLIEMSLCHTSSQAKLEASIWSAQKKFHSITLALKQQYLMKAIPHPCKHKCLRAKPDLCHLSFCVLSEKHKLENREEKRITAETKRMKQRESVHPA